MAGPPSSHVRLVHVPLGHRGTTDYLLTEPLGNSTWPDYSSILYLTPHPAKAREAQGRFHRLVRHPYIPPRFRTIKQLAMDLFSREMPGRRLPRVLAPLVIAELSGQGIGYARIIADLLRELKQHAPLSGIEQVHQDLTAIFGRLGIPDDTRHTMDAAMTVFRSYQEALTGAGYFDDDDILAYACSAIERAGDHCSVLIADGFTDMTAVEQALLRAMTYGAGSAIITSPHAEDGCPPADFVAGLRAHFRVAEEQLEAAGAKDLSYVAYPGVEEEFEGIARNLRGLHASGRQVLGEQTVVATPALQGHLPLIRRVFRRYGIPFAVAAGSTPLSKPRMRDIFSLLDAVADDFPRLPFTSFLNSPFFAAIDPAVRSRIPSLSLRSGIIKGRSSWDTLGAVCDDKQTGRAVTEGLAAVFGLLDELSSMREGCAAAAFSSAVDDLLERLGFSGDDETRDELRTAMELAGHVQGLSGGGPLPLRRHVEHLRHILRSAEHRHDDAPVRLMDFGETRGLEPDRLYFCGLKDGALPSRPPVDLVLPDSVRAEYGLITFRRFLGLQKLDFRRLCGASGEVHLSYPAVEGDKVNLPSPFLPWGGERREQVFGIFSEAELQARRGSHNLADSITEIRVDARTRDRITRRELAMPLRVTDIDAFRRCPRRFFIERVLDLEASEVAEYQVEARLLGTLVHKVMERLLLTTMQDLETARADADGILYDVMAAAPIEPYWSGLIRAAFLEMLPAIMEQESAMRAEGFLPDRLEMKVEERVTPGISLKGKVDRIDRKDTVFRIIDYKTGSSEIGSGIIRKGKDLQLPLYAAMLGARGMEVERTGIYSLRKISVQWIPTKRDRHSLADYVQAALGYLEDAVAEMQAGRFTAAPVEEFICATCPEAPFCPYIHARGGTADA